MYVLTCVCLKDVLIYHHTGQEFFAVEVAANALVSSSEPCMRLIREAARALYNETFPSGMSHLCRPPTQIPMKWWPRDTLRAGEVIHILGQSYACHSVLWASEASHTQIMSME